MTDLKETLKEWIDYLFPNCRALTRTACDYSWVISLSKIAPRMIGMLVLFMFGVGLVTRNRENVFIIILMQTLFFLGIYGLLLLFLKWKKRNPAVLRILGIVIPLYGLIGVMSYTMLSSHMHDKFNQSPRTLQIKRTTNRVRTTIDETKNSLDEKFNAHEKAVQNHYQKTHRTIQQMGDKIDEKFEEKKNNFLNSFKEDWDYRMNQRKERDLETMRRVQQREEEKKRLIRDKTQEKHTLIPETQNINSEDK